MELVPLQQFRCDTCGGIIQSVQDGWLEWLKDNDGHHHGYRIVHHKKASPLSGKHYCYYDSDALDTLDMHLESFVGLDGLDILLGFLEDSPVRDPKEVCEIIRRLHVPYYEEARGYFPTAEADGVFARDTQYYTQENLQKVINKYGS